MTTPAPRPPDPPAAGRDTGRAALVFRSAVAGIEWPAVGSDGAAQLLALLHQFDQSQWQSPETLRERQLGQLRWLLRHAALTVPYYAQSLRGRPSDLPDWDAWRQLPVLTRAALQQDFQALKSTAVPPGHGAVTEGQSTGSTGRPVRFLRTAVTQLIWNALTLREHLWQGRDFGRKLAAIRVKVQEAAWPDWGVPAAAVFRTGPAATLNIRTDLSRQLEWLVREDPTYLITHTSNLAALAELSQARGVRLPNLQQARSFSEVLRPDLRALVREAWGVEVADVYSCEEGGYIALQCPRHEHYHVQSENVLVEVLDESGNPCGPGETGRVVLTPLHNFALPLIRYALGDYAEVGAPCACGRGLPVLTRIHGRRRNMIVLPDGSRHWPTFPATLWLDFEPIRQYQLVQTGADTIVLNCVLSRPLTVEETTRLVQALQQRLGHPFAIELQPVAQIERGPGNKYEDFISQLGP
ncbi:MAG: phenylacetate--CoA ligase family protein [Gammaproteobacteria bacterium]|nr:phenylacetate--CoA ligase family protein [Gammaproteobacteria bacterium]